MKVNFVTKSRNGPEIDFHERAPLNSALLVTEWLEFQIYLSLLPGLWGPPTFRECNELQDD